MHRLALLVPLLLFACRHDLDAERAPMLRELCAAYCPERLACVDDGFAGGDVDACVEQCADEERFLEDSDCGRASFAALECLTGLACGELPAAVRAVTSNGVGIACRDLLLEEQELCDFTPRY